MGTTYSILVQATNLRLDEIVEKPVHRLVIIEHNEKLYQVGELYTLEHLPCGEPWVVMGGLGSLLSLSLSYYTKLNSSYRPV